jgi:hypothetical protein
MRSPAAISPTNSVQANSAPAATMNFLRPSLITLLYRSTSPLARGWALYMSTCLQPMLSRYTLKAPLNSVPWSHLTRAGGPYRQVMVSWNHVATVLLALFFMGPISTHLVIGSTATTACISPPAPGGVRFVIRSMHHWKKGYVALLVGCRCGGGLKRAASTWLGTSSVHQVMISRYMEVQ